MIKIAILGFGIVGSGVAEVVTLNAGHIAKRIGDALEIKYILDVRDFPESPYKNLMVKDFSVIENDPEITAVAEVIGGCGAAYEFTRRALTAGKSVVTSNKELVAEHGAELLQLAQDKRVRYLFEASVGGGVPVIRPLARCLAANRIAEVVGILNGTCNYILTRMADGGLSFEEALREAQRFGYAEAHPSADIEGHDTTRKICILASLSFGKHIYPKGVHTEGIDEINIGMIDEARKNGYAVKLIGRATRANGEDTINIITAPYLVPRNHPFFAVSDVFNAVMVTGDATGEVMFYGKGAGKLPTASAVAADVIDCVIGGSGTLSWIDGDRMQIYGQPPSSYYTFRNGAVLRVLE